MVQEPAFALDTAAVAGERAVGADDSMAGDDDANRIGAVGEANRPYRGGTAEACGEMSIGNSGTARNLAQGDPDLALERCVPAVATGSVSMTCNSPAK